MDELKPGNKTKKKRKLKQEKKLGEKTYLAAAQ
jgi:hypothetical protein